MAKNNLYTFLLGIFLFVCVVYPTMWWFSLGKYDEAEHWLKPLFEEKLISAEKINGRKIIISSGSNSLFGVDSILLQSETGLPVINLAGHAALTLEFHAEQILKVVSSGDIVIMPLEDAYYYREWKLTDWQTDNMETWGHDHIQNYSYVETVRYLMHSEIKDVVKRMLFSDKINNSSSLQDEYEKARLRSLSNKYEWNGYSLTYMNHLGDILVEHKVLNRMLESMGGIPYFGSDKVSSHFISSILSLKERVESHGARLYLTWPATIRNEAFDLNSQKHASKLLSIEKQVSDAGIDMICKPENFHFDVTYFFNTKYHLNMSGAIKRTNNLFSCLVLEGVISPS